MAESKRSNSDIVSSSVSTTTFIWTINMNMSVTIDDEVIDFEFNKKYSFTDFQISSSWMQSAIMKGYLKSVS